jgi:hypothetical protein
MPIDYRCEGGRRRPELRPDIRSIPVGNYVIFYRLAAANIEIAWILHGRRDIKRVFEQLARVSPQITLRSRSDATSSALSPNSSL